MSAEITQANVRLLIPGKAARVASKIAERRAVSPKEALLSFYRSETYRKLERESTKYWHYSPAQLFAVSGFAKSAKTASSKRGPGKSILLPYRDIILHAWTRERKSAREIAEILRKNGVHTSPQNIWKFIQRQCSKQA